MRKEKENHKRMRSRRRRNGKDKERIYYACGKFKKKHGVESKRKNE